MTTPDKKNQFTSNFKCFNYKFSYHIEFLCINLMLDLLDGIHLECIKFMHHTWIINT